MQQRFISQDNTMISSRQKYLMSIVSGLLLAVLEVAIILNILYFHIDYFHLSPGTLVSSAALIYFLAPIPLSFYISRQTGSANEGCKTGSIAGFSGALLTVLTVGVYLFATGRTLPGLDQNPERGDTIFFVLIIFVFLNALGALFSLLGASIGGVLGKISKRIMR